MSGRLSQFHPGGKEGLGKGMGKERKRKRERKQEGSAFLSLAAAPCFFLLCFLFSPAFHSLRETMGRERKGRPGLMTGRHRPRKRLPDGR